MRKLQITKIVVSMMLVLGLATSSFAMGQSDKKTARNIHNDKVKVENKIEKKDIKVITVVKKDSHKKDFKVAKHHQKYHNHKKDIVVVEKHYVNNNTNNNVAAACAAAVGIGLLAVAIANS